ncbi:MAG TPA: hypothetical protein VKE26_06935 [Xanthobacteraceae bacterium]|nr:hypothetical protein [Xanthobacteraceae bacterium]
MRFSEDDLRAAVAAGALDGERLDGLVAFLKARAAPTPTAAPQFDLAHVLWYAGALIVIGAMGMFSTLAFSQMGGVALATTAVIYAIVFAAAGHHLWHRRNLRTPGGLLIAIAVAMAPLAVYGIQDALGLWGTFGQPGTVRDFYVWIKGSWVFMEIATIVAGVVALWFYRFPFIVAIIAVALWFMSMDLTPWLFGRAEFTWDERRVVSMWFGLGVLLVAWIVDRRPRGGDFAFWLHLFGLMAFWGGLSLTESSSEIAKALYCLLNVGLVLLSVLLGRRVYAVFGTLGIAGYLTYLAQRVFKDSLMFPFALSLIGVAVIAAGLLYHRKQDAIAAWLAKVLPDAIKRLRPAHAP